VATTFKPGECVPINLFGENVNSPAAIKFITADTIDRLRLTQNVVSGSLTGNTGSFFKLPGGPVGFAAGGEYRKETSDFIADPLAAQGLTFGNSLGNTSGKFDVWEVFGEVSAPLLSHVPFADTLELNAAIRYSHYSTVGSTTAWKVGGTYAPVHDISFRGTYSKAVRAPNISELFGASSQTFLFVDDPCNTNNVNNGTQYRAANCAALLTGLGADPANYTDTRSTNLSGTVGSNPNLRAETADTWTVGVVLQPSFIPRLLITADWYNIKIKDAINTATLQQLAELCVDQSSLNNQYCKLITRENGGDNPGFITDYTLQPFNVAAFKTSGLDVVVDYSLPTSRAGTFSLHVVANYLHELTFVPVPGGAPVNEAYESGESSDGILAPKFQVTSDIGWKISKFNLNWRINYYSGVLRDTQQNTASIPNIYDPQYVKIKARFSHDIYAEFQVNDKFQFYGGVNNLFNQQPDLGELNTPINAIGRFFYMGARVKLADLFQ
jgi:iron complex outermembrane receptor protein